MAELEGLTFEAALAELESLIQRLEQGDLALEETVTLYQRGRALTEHCQARLDEAALRVRQLSPDGEHVTDISPTEA